MSGQGRLFTTRQVANELKLNVSRIRQLAADLGIGQKLGRDWVFTEDDLERLQKRETKSGPKPQPRQPPP